MLKRTFAAYPVQDIERKFDLKFEQAILPEKAIRFSFGTWNEKKSVLVYAMYFISRRGYFLI